MKILVTRTSERADYGRVTDYKSLEDCIDHLLKAEDKTDEFVVSKVPEYYPEEAQQCEWRVEIYDTWRE